MIGARSRGLLLLAALHLALPCAASGGTIGPSALHREDVDESRYPWSAIGKLYNETGASCSGVLIARDKVLTAAHCLFNYRTQRFIPAGALHFLVGYRTGRYSAHVRIARYEIGTGFDPLRYDQTSAADWAVLTVTESLPAAIEPLRLRRDAAPSGTKAVLVGYPQDRAFAMTADRDCELRENIDAGRLVLHTCRGISGTSGAPILVSAGNNEMQIAGIQIAGFRRGATEAMVAVPAQAIWNRGQGDGRGGEPVAEPSREPAAAVCHSDGASVALTDIRAKLGLELVASDQADFDTLDIVSSTDEWSRAQPAAVLAWFASDSFAFAVP